MPTAFLVLLTETSEQPCQSVTSSARLNGEECPGNLTDTSSPVLSSVDTESSSHGAHTPARAGSHTAAQWAPRIPQPCKPASGSGHSWGAVASHPKCALMLCLSLNHLGPQPAQKCQGPMMQIPAERERKWIPKTPWWREGSGNCFVMCCQACHAGQACRRLSPFSVV